LRQSQHLPRRKEPLSEALGWRKRVIAKKLENGWNVTDCREGCVAVPVANGGSVHTDLLRNVRLEEVEVESATADVVA
jgi:hypothetical protein